MNLMNGDRWTFFGRQGQNGPKVDKLVEDLKKSSKPLIKPLEVFISFCSTFKIISNKN